MNQSSICIKQLTTAAALASMLTLGFSTTAGNNHQQVANLRVVGDPTSVLTGAATLMRSRRWVRANVHASGLDPSLVDLAVVYRSAGRLNASLVAVRSPTYRQQRR